MRIGSARGAGLVEYALLIVGVLIVGGAAYRELGRSAARAARDAGACLAGNCGASADGAPTSGGYGSTIGESGGAGSGTMKASGSATAGTGVSGSASGSAGAMAAGGSASAAGSPGAGGRGSANLAPAVAPAESDADKFNRLLAKQQRGERMTPDDIAFMQKLGATSDKGLVTLSVGVSGTLKGPGGVFVKGSAEANTDNGVVATGSAGDSQTVDGVKITGRADVSTKGAPKGAVSWEVPVYKRSIGKVASGGVAVGREVQTNGLSNEYVKGNVEASVKGPFGTEAKGEIYAKATFNNLTPAEQRALGAGMAARAAAMGNARADNMALFQYNRARVAKGLPPVDALP